MGQRRYSIKRSEKPVDNVKVILNFLKMKDLDWQIGKTKVFLRSSVSNVLEENRKRILHDSAIVIQRQYKGWKRRKGNQTLFTIVVCLPCWPLYPVQKWLPATLIPCNWLYYYLK